MKKIIFILSIIISHLFVIGQPMLSEKNGKFGFINWRHETLIDFKYDKADEFNIENNKFAKVTYNNEQYLINTDGEEFLLTNYNESLKSNTQALIIDTDNEKYYKAIISQITKKSDIRILIISSENNIFPDELYLLKKLEHLGCHGYCDSIIDFSKFNKIKGLSLSESGIEIVSKKIKNLKQLEYIDLSNTFISEIPVFLVRLPKLKYLDCSKTELNNDSFRFTLRYNRFKKILFASNFYFDMQARNNLNEENTLCIKIDSFFLDEYYFYAQIFECRSYKKSIFIDKYAIECFREIDVSYLSDLEISPHIEDLYNLTSIRFANCGLTEIPSEIGNLYYLESIDLYNNDITILPIKVLNNRLKYLNLERNKISSSELVY